MKTDEAWKIVAVLFASYPNANLERRHGEAYVAGLSDLDADACGKAAQRLCRTSKFLPSIAEIREAAADASVGPRRTGIEAWELLQKAIRKFGWPKPPKITSPHITHALWAIGGWHAACSLTASETPSARARFIEAYDQSSLRVRQDVTSGIPLPGLANPDLLPRGQS